MFQSAYNTLHSYIAPYATTAMAHLGVSAGMDVYASVPEAMYETPRTNQEAADLASYWLFLGARRADYDDRKAAQSQLYTAATRLQAIAAAEPTLFSTTPPFVHPLVGLQNATGFGGATQSPFFYIDQAIETVRYADLLPFDKNKIEGTLTDIRQRMALQYWSTTAAYTFAGLAAGYALHQAIRHFRS